MKMRWLKRMGYKTDQEGIIRRFLNEDGAWNSHIKNTKDVIIEQSEQIQEKKTVLVLGSGWLLDIPIDFLCKTFTNVVLTDIFHPKEIVKKYSKYTNIVWLQCDLTGIAENVFAIGRKGSKNFNDELKKVKIYPPALNVKANYVISANILSQLDELIIDYLKKYQEIDTEILAGFRRKIQEKHLDFLKKSKSVLITDIEELYFNRDAELVEQVCLMYCKLPESRIITEWEWTFDSKMTYRRNNVTYRKVKAYSFIEN